jgi:hypothetical protein
MQFTAGEEVYTGENFTGVPKKMVWDLTMLCHWVSCFLQSERTLCPQIQGLTNPEYVRCWDRYIL